MTALAIVFAILSSVASVLACTCVNTAAISVEQHSKYLKNVQAIFEGEVISVGEKTMIPIQRGEHSYEMGVRPVVFKVFRVWKGSEQAEITVEADASSSCSFVPDVGRRSIVYAHAGYKENTLS